MPLDHYVSQVHLRKFYSPALGNKLMYAIRKSNLKFFTPNSQSVCRVLDGSTNAYLREARWIEEFLKSIEPRYNSAVSNLAEDKINWDCIFTIAGFAAFVIGCSPTSARINPEPLQKIVERLAIDAEKRGEIPLPPEELKGRTLQDLLRSGDIRVDVDPKYPQAIIISNILQNVVAFGNFNWDILLNDFDDTPFFTSDFPAAIEETKDWRIVNRIIPLAPNVAVRIRPNFRFDRKTADLTFSRFGRHIKRVGREDVSEINRVIVQSAEDVVFFRDNHEWVTRFIERNRLFRVEQRTIEMPREGGTYLISMQRIRPFNFATES